MTTWLTLFAVTVILTAVGIGPIILRGGAWNYAVMVQLSPNEITEQPYNSPEGRRAQERIDWVHRWIGALLIVMPAQCVIALLSLNVTSKQLLNSPQCEPQKSRF